METRLIVIGKVVFGVCIRFGVRSVFRWQVWIVWLFVAVSDGFGILAADLRANGAPYAFMAAIIAGMPMMFITRVIL